ncbi:MAG: putative RNA-binding protein (virulence factor B family) [Halioglobus sp.]|jgi:predicted RNA-binding protein (virulence factor B family)
MNTTTPQDVVQIGRRYSLAISKTMPFGVYLNAQNLGDILLPAKYVAGDAAVGDLVEVFLYLDSEDRPVATTEHPKAEVGQFAYLEAVANTDVGTFLDWGLDKDILVPFSEQHKPMQVADFYLVYLYLNDIDGRLVASSKIDKFLSDETPHDFRPQQSVQLIIANSTELGFKAIVDHSHWGVLYSNDVHQRLSFGQSIGGYIKRVRSDNKIDLSLQGGKETRDQHAQLIMDYLTEQGGFAPVHDKSDPKLIARLFGMSKGAFKKTVGGLYKRELISIEKDGIRLRQD